MLKSPPAEVDPLIDANPRQKESSIYDASDESHESVSRASYAKYHKVCDMRIVLDVSPVGICGVALTFLLVFTSWCGWHELVEWVGVSRELEGSNLITFASIVNAITATGLILLIVGMRFIVGPVLSYHWRSVFAGLLVMTAITVWEALEALIDVLIGSDASQRATLYLVACGVVCILTLVFEKVFQYDVIGTHLIIPP